MRVVDLRIAGITVYAMASKDGNMAVAKYVRISLLVLFELTMRWRMGLMQVIWTLSCLSAPHTVGHGPHNMELMPTVGLALLTKFPS